MAVAAGYGTCGVVKRKRSALTHGGGDETNEPLPPRDNPGLGTECTTVVGTTSSTGLLEIL